MTFRNSVQSSKQPFQWLCIGCLPPFLLVLGQKKLPNHLLKDATIPSVETEEWNFSSVGTLSDTVEVGVPLFNIETGVGEGGHNFSN